jgi:hypothetical protein
MPSTVGAVLRLLGNIEEVQFFYKIQKTVKRPTLEPFIQRQI